MFGPRSFGPSLFSQRLFGPSLFGPDMIGLRLFGLRSFGPTMFRPGLFSPGLFGSRLFGPDLFCSGLFGLGVFGPRIFNKGQAKWASCNMICFNVGRTCIHCIAYFIIFYIFVFFHFIPYPTLLKIGETCNWFTHTHYVQRFTREEFFVPYSNIKSSENTQIWKRIWNRLQYTAPSV